MPTDSFNPIMKLNLLILLILFTYNLFGQEQPVEMADIFRQEGKIYVVIAVIVLILIGLFIYLISIDKRLKKIQDKFQDYKTNNH